MSKLLPTSLLLSVASLALSAACGGTGDPQVASSGSTGAGAAGGTSPSSSSAGGSGGAGAGSASSTSSTGPTSSSASGGGAGGSGGSVSQGLVRFAAMGDVGKGNQGQKDVAAAIAAKCAMDGCDFVQLLGDNIYDSGVSSTSDPQWQEKFEVPYAGVNLPFWVVLGNHDYGGEGTGNEFGKGQNEIDYSAISTKWKLPSAYYKRTQEHVEFFALDTNMAMYYQAAQQKSDVAAWLAASQAPWKIAFGHHPYLSNGPHGNAGEYEGLPFIPIVNGAGVKELLDDTICGAADVYICGHDHSTQLLTGKCGGTTELIVAGAGAATSELGGSNSTYYETLDLGFVYVRIDGNVLTAEVIDTAGNIAHSRTITK